MEIKCLKWFYQVYIVYLMEYFLKNLHQYLAPLVMYDPTSTNQERARITNQWIDSS